MCRKGNDSSGIVVARLGAGREKKINYSSSPLCALNPKICEICNPHMPYSWAFYFSTSVFILILAPHLFAVLSLYYSFHCL